MQPITIIILSLIILITGLTLYLVFPKNKKVKISRKNLVNPFCRNYKLSLNLDANIEYSLLSKFCLQRGIDLIIYNSKPSNIELDFTKLIANDNQYTLLYQIGEFKAVNCGVPFFCTAETAQNSTCDSLKLEDCVYGENSVNCGANCKQNCTSDNLDNMSYLADNYKLIACQQACPVEIGTNVCQPACSDVSTCQIQCKLQPIICRDYSYQNCIDKCVSACQKYYQLKFEDTSCQMSCQTNCQGCYNCYHTIYYQYRNQPQKMLNAFSKFFPVGMKKKVAISVMCAHQVLGLPISRNAIQPFDSFGSWNWTQFEIFIDLLVNKYNLEEVRIDSWTTIPKAWIN